MLFVPICPAVEVCFDLLSELFLVKCAALGRITSSRPKLRFAEGERVVVRIRNSNDGLECWCSGRVAALWPQLPGERQWDIDDITGEFPKEVPYRVDLVAGPPNWIFVHWDSHTLIRREGFQPQTKVKRISKRLEIRRRDDGTMEQVDHLTERRKPVSQINADVDMSDSDSDQD